MRAIRKAPGILSLLSLLLLGCADDKQRIDNDLLPRRTVLFYLATDNNLSGEIPVRMEELKKAWSGYDGNLLVFHDDKQEPKLWRVRGEDRGDVKVELVRSYPEMNSASSEVFAQVVNEVKQQFPARGYGLWVFSHGTGWLPSGMYTSPKSITIDGNHEMEVADMAKAIPDGLFDFIVMEACYMGSVEVAYELRNKTKYLVASSSEIVAPGYVGVMANVMPKLFTEQPDLVGLAQAFFGYWSSREERVRAATVSVVKSSELDSLARIVRSINQQDSVISSAASLQAFNRSSPYLFYDLSDCIKGVATKSDYDKFCLQLQRSVVYAAATQQFVVGGYGYPIRSHCGLTTYLKQRQYPILNSAYSKTSWGKMVGGFWHALP